MEDRNKLFPFSDEKVQDHQYYVYCITIYLFLTTTNCIFTSNTHYHWKGIDFVGVIVLRIIHFLKNLKPIKMNFFAKLIELHDLKEGISFWSFSFHSRIFHSFGDVIITGEWLQHFTLARHFMAIESWGFFRVPHLLWHWASVYNCHLRGPLTLTLNCERLAVELSIPVLTT